VRRPTTLAITVLAVVAALLAACGGGSEEGVRDVSAGDAAELLAAEDGLVVIDVRTAEEFAAGHVEGAMNIDVQRPSFAAEIGRFDRDGDYLVYCRTGNRSAVATAAMEDMGFTSVRNVSDGGFDELAAAGAPVAR
jgi:phage shock protein E